MGVGFQTMFLIFRIQKNSEAEVHEDKWMVLQDKGTPLFIFVFMELQVKFNLERLPLGVPGGLAG